MTEFREVTQRWLLMVLRKARLLLARQAALALAASDRHAAPLRPRQLQQLEVC
jgi:hypothetical protein